MITLQRFLRKRCKISMFAHVSKMISQEVYTMAMMVTNSAHVLFDAHEGDSLISAVALPNCS